MKKSINSYIKLGNKKYEYTLTPNLQEDGHTVTHVLCEGACLDQTFLSEDIPQLILDLPELIADEMEFEKEQKTKSIRIRLSAREKFEIEKRAHEKGYANTSEYLRNLALA